jgi:hypothetical protein
LFSFRVQPAFGTSSQHCNSLLYSVIPCVIVQILWSFRLLLSFKHCDCILVWGITIVMVYSAINFCPSGCSYL